MFERPVRRVSTTPPLGHQQVGDSLHLHLDRPDPFPAEITARERRTVTGRGDVDFYSWRELTPVTGGRFAVVENGRSGTADANPAFEAGGVVVAAPEDVVWLTPGWNDPDHGQEWFFRCDCAEYSITPGGTIETYCCERTPRLMCASFSERTGVMAGVPDRAVFTLLPENEWLFDDPCWEWEDTRTLTHPETGEVTEVTYRVVISCASDPVILQNNPPYRGWYYVNFAAGAYTFASTFTQQDCRPFRASGTLGTFGPDEFGFGESKGTAAFTLREQVDDCEGQWPEAFDASCCDGVPLPMALKATISGGTGNLAGRDGEYTLYTVGYLAPDCAASWTYNETDPVLFGIGLACDFQNFNCDQWLITGVANHCPFVFPHTASLVACSCSPFFLVFSVNDPTTIPATTATVTITLP